MVLRQARFSSRINGKKIFLNSPTSHVHFTFGTADHPDAYRLGQQIQLGCEIHRLASVLDSEKGIQVDMSDLDHPERAPFELEVENELDQLFAEAEEVDKNIDRLLTRVGLDVIAVRDPESSASSNIVEASPEVAQSIGDGNIESNTHLRPSASAGTFPPSQPSIAADALRDSMGRLGTRYTIPTTAIPVSVARETSKEDAKLAFLQSLPLLPASDHPEAITTCPICQEAFENTARPEVPVRLPCQHVFGALCISSWMSIKETCPLCRTVLFDPGFPSDRDVGWTTRVPQPVRRPGLPRFAPLMLHITGGSLEANIRRIEAHIWELAEESGWLLATQASLELSPNTDEVLAQIDACLSSNTHLTNRLIDRHQRYRTAIWAEATW